jgi:hypothetical protein
MPPPSAALGYWLGLPLRWAYQAAHNGHGITRVLDITKVRPLPAGLVGLDHPWVTGLNPATGKPVWHENVIYRSPRSRDDFADDEVVVAATGKFLAERVRQSAVTPELPVGPKRRMPHGINYIHGASHYNSGIIVLNDFADGYRHICDPTFRRELYRFVRAERREVLFLFRDREYTPRDYAYFSCCMRAVFPWFCNPNGPREKVLWGNAAPFPAANLITGRWIADVYALKRPGGAEAVVRPPVAPHTYFQSGPYDRGRETAAWPEKLLAWATYFRVRVRGSRGGMFFVDRRRVYADQIAGRRARGFADRPQARL